MRNFIEDFKAFAMRGNIVDLAVAVIIGTAFGKIVSSLVENIVMPLMGVILGGIDFTTFSFTVGDSVIKYGIFLQSIFDFVIIALAIFVAIRALAKLKRKETVVPDVAKPIPEEIQLLREIRDSLRK